MNGTIHLIESGYLERVSFKKDFPEDFALGKNCVPFIKVVYAQHIDYIELMITDPNVDAYSKWSKPVKLDCKNDIEFTFIELFEWDRYGFVGHPYYLTKITRHPDG